MPTVSPFKPLLDPKSAERIAQSVTHLEVPSEAMLLQALRDVQQQLDHQQYLLEAALEEHRATGHAALVHLLLSDADIKAMPDPHYFKRN